MNQPLEEIRSNLIGILKEHLGPLRVRVDKPTNFEVTGTIEAMQGKQKVDGIYFASIVPKPNDIRFYFFPSYTHAEQLKDLSPALAACKKGKSCFHVKKLDEELAQDIRDLVSKGVALYQEDGLILSYPKL